MSGRRYGRSNHYERRRSRSPTSWHRPPRHRRYSSGSEPDYDHRNNHSTFRGRDYRNWDRYEVGYRGRGRSHYHHRGDRYYNYPERRYSEHDHHRSDGGRHWHQSSSRRHRRSRTRSRTPPPRRDRKHDKSPKVSEAKRHSRQSSSPSCSSTSSSSDSDFGKTQPKKVVNDGENKIEVIQLHKQSEPKVLVPVVQVGNSVKKKKTVKGLSGADYKKEYMAKRLVFMKDERLRDEKMKKDLERLQKKFRNNRDENQNQKEITVVTVDDDGPDPGSSVACRSILNDLLDGMFAQIDAKKKRKI